MKKPLSFFAPPFGLAFSLMSVMGCGGGSAIQNTSADQVPDTTAHDLAWRIDSLMKTRFAADGPGVVLAVALDSGAHPVTGGKSTNTENWSATFATGVNDFESKKPVTQNSVFNIGSLTKQFTARAVLACEGMGSRHLSLTDAIGKYLSGLHPAIASLTIDQLLSHCSGIPDHYSFTDTNKVKHATDSDVLDAIRKADTLYFPAGSRYRYSNTAYCLLGLLIEKLSGIPYEQAVKRPMNNHGENGVLDLPDLSFLPSTGVIGKRVHGYEKDKSGKWLESDAPESIFFTTQADGGALISMSGYMAWCEMLEDFFSRGFTFPEFQPHTLVDTAAGLYYGYGWFILPRKTDAGPLIYHTGFNGGFRTSVLLIPRLHYRIAIFSASPGVDLEDLVHQINQLLGIDDKGFIKSGPLES